VVSFSSTVSVQSTSSHANNNGIVVAYSSAGDAQWAAIASSDNGLSRFNAVTADSSGAVYVVGETNSNGTFDFGNGVTTQSGKADSGTYSAVIVKYSASGTAQWAQTTQMPDGEQATGVSRFDGVAVSGSSVYAAGTQIGTTSFKYGDGLSDIALSANSSGDNALLVRFDTATGTSTFGYVSDGSTGASRFYDVATGPDGSLYAVGFQVGTNSFTYDGQSAQSTLNAESPVIVKNDSSGRAVWARSLTGTSGTNRLSLATFYGVAAGQDGTISAAGAANTSADFTFGPGITATGQAVGSYNPLMVTYDGTGNALWARSNTTGAVEGFFEDVSVTSIGRVVGVGYYDGNGSYGFGPQATITGSSVDWNPLIAAFAQ
jgi:hypothetical protein